MSRVYICNALSPVVVETLLRFVREITSFHESDASAAAVRPHLLFLFGVFFSVKYSTSVCFLSVDKGTSLWRCRFQLIATFLFLSFCSS